MANPMTPKELAAFLSENKPDTLPTSVDLSSLSSPQGVKAPSSVPTPVAPQQQNKAFNLDEDILGSILPFDLKGLDPKKEAPKPFVDESRIPYNEDTLPYTQAFAKQAPDTSKPSLPSERSVASDKPVASADDQLDSFLKKTRMIESSDRKNLDHAVITDPKSMHYGTRAGGGYGLMPLTAKDLISKDPELRAKYGDLLKSGPDEITDALNTNAQMDDDIARALAKSHQKEFGGDETMMNYAWQYGAKGAKDTDYDDIINSDREAKYAKLSGIAPYPGPWSPEYLSQKQKDKDLLAQDSSNKKPASDDSVPAAPTRQPASDIASLVKSIYGNGLDDSALKSAQDKANTNRLIANVMSGSEEIGHALARANTPVDNTFYNNLVKQAEQPVADIMERRKAKDQEVGRLADMTKLSETLDDKNADSERSRRMRAIYKQALPSLGTMPGFDQLSAHDLSTAQNVLELHEKGLNRLAETKLKTDEKLQKQADDYYKHAVDMANSPRFSTPDVQQAYKDRYAASKALHLFEKYPDLNNVPEKLKNLVVEEIGKIASGGKPTSEEFKALNTETARSKFANWISTLKGSPSPAKLGAFLKDYKDYTETLHNNANNLIDANVGRIGRLMRNNMGEKNYQNFVREYVTQDDPYAKQEKAISPEVADYAKTHNLTPEQAQAIFEMRAKKAAQ